MNNSQLSELKEEEHFNNKLRGILILVEQGGVPDATRAYEDVKFLLAQEGLGSNCYLGADMKEGDDVCARWFAGQFLSIVETNSWFAMNSFLNCMDRFCPSK